MKLLAAIMILIWVWLIIEIINAPVMDDNGNYK